MRTWSLSFLSCLGESPEAVVRAAAKAGYDHVGLRLAPAAPGGVAFPLMDEPQRERDLLSLMRDCGVTVFDIEMIRLGPGFDPEPWRSFLECSARLGARAILVANDDSDEARATDAFGRLCDAAEGTGLWIDLEFMPQSETPDLAAALRILRAVDRPNQGVIVDALHVSRARTTPQEIAAVPRRWLHYAQICDGPAEIPTTREALNYAARHERLMPGEGGVDLPAIFAALPDDIPLAVEVPNDKASAGWTLEAWARRGKEAALAVLAKNEMRQGGTAP